MIVKTDNYYMFWKSDSTLSNWSFTPMVWKGHKINYSEIAMMYEKAVLFNDNIMAEKIIKSKNPKDAKALGRMVSKFDNKIWESNRERIMISILLEKVKQSKDTYNEVYNNKHLHFVEASPYDCIWGIGLAPDNKLSQDKNNWKGLNLLGKCWDTVGETL